jgi:lysophospholipase L1-like esterase
VQLTKGKSAELRLEYFHVTGAPLLKLEWEAPGLDREVVPVDSLQDPDGKASGLRAEYYAGPSFETKVATLTGQRGEYPGPAPSPFAPPRHEGPLQMTLDVAPGRYRLEWLDPASGGRLGHALALDHVGGPLPLMSPAFTDDLALRLVPGNAANLAFLRGVPRPLRVLALGDSNTARANGYRSPLKSRLDAAGLVTDFVGSKSSGPVDGEHEGYPGEGVARIRERLRQGILSDTRPDVVLLMIGANDLWVSLKDRRPTTDEAAGELVGRFDELLTQLAAQAPSCHVVVAKPTTPTNAARPLELFRAGLDRLVSERREKGQAISLVDCRGAANDGVHFSADGAATLADRFFAELDRVARLPVPRASKT